MPDKNRTSASGSFSDAFQMSSWHSPHNKIFPDNGNFAVFEWPLSLSIEGMDSSAQHSHPLPLHPLLPQMEAREVTTTGTMKRAEAKSIAHLLKNGTFSF
jgi:hypothetical protein